MKFKRFLVWEWTEIISRWEKILTVDGTDFLAIELDTQAVFPLGHAAYAQRQNIVVVVSSCVRNALHFFCCLALATAIRSLSTANTH